MVLLITIDYQTSTIKYVWNALHRQDDKNYIKNCLN